MSFVIAAPELLHSAAQDLASINTSLAEATAIAFAPTTGIAAAAQDEVSSAIASLFGEFGQEFQTLSSQSQIFHQEFVELMSAGAQAYAVAEGSNAERTLLGALSATGQSLFGNTLPSGAAAASSMTGLASFVGTVAAPYQTLVANTVSNAQAIGSTLSAYRFPFLQQLVSNQLGYGQTIATSIEAGIANFPAELANLPTAIETGVQQLLTINPVSLLQGFVDSQVSFAQTISGGLLGAARDLGTGLQSLPPGLTAAFQDLLSGKGAAAYADLNSALVNAFLPGFDATVTLTDSGSALVDIIPMGPLGELAPILALPGQMAQNFTNLLPPGSVPAQISQNATNLVSALTNFGTTLSISNTAHLTFGLPLQLVLDGIGGPANALSAVNASSVAFVSAIQAGNVPAAAAAILDAPAVIANAYLNGTTVISLPPALVDLLGTGTPLPSTTEIQLGGILAPLSLPQVFVNAGPGFEHLQLELSGDTEIGGLIPGLLSFGTQLAQAITPMS